MNSVDNKFDFAAVAVDTFVSDGKSVPQVIVHSSVCNDDDVDLVLDMVDKPTGLTAIDVHIAVVVILSDTLFDYYYGHDILNRLNPFLTLNYLNLIASFVLNQYHIHRMNSTDSISLIRSIRRNSKTLVHRLLVVTENTIYL